MFTHDYSKAKPPRRTGRPVVLEAQIARSRLDRQGSVTRGREKAFGSGIRNAGAVLTNVLAGLRVWVGRGRGGGLRRPLPE
jgi:hypothetical protein